MTNEEMTQHVETIAEQNGVRVLWTRYQAFSYPAALVIEAPRIREPVDFLVAMHELGHVLNPVAREQDRLSGPESEILAEAGAWAWAALNSPEKATERLSEDDWRYVASLQVSYTRFHTMAHYPERPQALT